MKNTDHKQTRTLINEYVKGSQREFLIISEWINTVIKNDYWGLIDYQNDILQDVRIKLYLNFKQKSFKFNSSLKTYVYRVTKFTCIDYLRKRYKANEISIESTKIDESDDCIQKLVIQEQQEILNKIFYRLQEKCRTILKKVFIEKMSYKKISAKLNIAEGTVKSRVSRCIDKAVQLRKELCR